MKLSISLVADDVDFLDAYASAHALQSRSAAVRRAVYALRLAELGTAYADAWQDWDGNEAAVWEPVAGDGL